MESQVVITLNSIVGYSKIWDAVLLWGAEYLPILLAVFSVVVVIMTTHMRGKELLSGPYFLYIRSIFQFALPIGIAWFLSDILKFMFAVARPYHVLPVTPLIEYSGYAFPSGHAAVLSALTVIMFYFDKKTGYVVLCSTVIALTLRVVAGIHYPSDILGGILLGWGTAYLFVKYIYGARKKS